MQMSSKKYDDMLRVMDWERGVKRTSLFTGETYATRADRIRADSRFKLPRVRRRKHPSARRAKSVRGENGL